MHKMHGLLVISMIREEILLMSHLCYNAWSFGHTQGKIKAGLSLMIREANLSISYLASNGAINYILYLCINVIFEVYLHLTEIHFSPSSGLFVTFNMIKFE